MGLSLPLYQLLSQEDLATIDRTGRQILEEVGLKITDAKHLDMLKAAGVEIDADNQLVRFPQNLLDDLIKRAPSRFTLYSRDRKNDLPMGEGKVHFANGGRVFRILDMSTGGYRLTMMRDIANTAILVDHMDYLRFYIIACQAHDLEPEYYHLNDYFRSFYHTTKHVMGGCDNLDGANQLWHLATIIAGGEDNLKAKPFFSIITNIISPLTVNGNTLDILNFFATRGIPVTCAPAPIAGATAPATLAGTLAQMHAESLAGVAITQILAPGAKVFYGAVPSAMDLRNMEYTMGSVEMGMMNAAAVQLAKVYNLPIYASGGVTEAKRPDIQAGFEKHFSNLTVAMSGADIIHLTAGLMDSGNSISYEQFVIDNEIIGRIHRELAGIEVTPETLGYDVIKRVGPGGNYVAEDHTVDHMMSEFFYPNLSIRCSFDIWEDQGRPDMLSRAHKLVKETLLNGRESRLSPATIQRIKQALPGIVKI